MMSLSQNQLKIIAAVAMAVDHIGARIFPQCGILRMIGRLAFPIFSYFIYEGFCYTRSRAKYFCRLFALGLGCMAVYLIYTGELYGNILITFSLSVILLCAVEYAIETGTSGTVILALCLLGVYFLCETVYIDYGILGVLAPVCAFVVGRNGHNKKTLAGFSLGVVALAIGVGGVQYYSLFALIPLALYSGNRGKRNMGRFFYWFYPLHLAAIELLSNFI